MNRKKLRKKGQFVISVALLIAVIAMTAALSIYLASMLHHRFRYKSYKEIVNNVDSDCERALINALSKATHEYIGAKPGGEIDLEHATYNYTALRLSAQNFMDFWKQTVINSYAGTGLEINLNYSNKILLSERKENYFGRGVTIPERWLYNLTKAYWFYPESISAIGADLSLNITGMGFYGFKSNKLIYLILSIDINDLRKQGEEYQQGGKPIDHIKVRILKEGMTPVHDLTTKNFLIRVFDLYTGSWRKADILDVKYEGDGNYTIYLPPQQPGSSPPSPSPGGTVTKTVTTTVTVTQTKWVTQTTTLPVTTVTQTVWVTQTTTLPVTTVTQTVWRTRTATVTESITTTTFTQPATTTILKTIMTTLTESSETTYTTTETTYYTTTTATETAASTTHTATATTTTTETIIDTKYTTTTITAFPTTTTTQVPVEEPITTVTTTVTVTVTVTVTRYTTITKYGSTETVTTTLTTTKTFYSSTTTIKTTLTAIVYTTTYQSTTTTTITQTSPTTVTATAIYTTTTTVPIIKTENATLSLISTTTTTTTALSETTVTTTKTITETTYRTTTVTITEVVLPLIYSIWFQVMVRDNRGIIVESMTYEYLDFMIERGYIPSISIPQNEWWNTNYKYCRQIIVLAGSSNVPSGYSVSITFNHASLVSSGKSLANGNDIRIVYWDGTSWIELDRVLDHWSSWNAPNTKIWFKTQANIPANSRDDNYYMYYGYSGATNPPANRDNVFLFWDDFESGSLSKWTVLRGIWDITTEAGHGYVARQLSSSYIECVLRSSSTIASDNIIIEGECRRVGGEVGYALRVSDAYHHYFVTHGGWVNHLAIGKIYGQGSYTKLVGVSGTVDTNWHIIRLSIIGSNLKASIDNEAPITAIDTQITTGNYIALRTYQYQSLWDYLHVRKYVDPEPTIYIKSERNNTGTQTYYPTYEVYNVEVMYSAENGTRWCWHGHNLTIYPYEMKPIPPVPIRFIRVNITRNGYSTNENDLLETVSQVEEWSEDLRKPLYVYEKDQTSARFGKTSKLVFNVVFPQDVNNQCIRIWWKDNLEAPPPTYGIKLSVEREFVIIDNGVYKLQLLAKGGYSYYIDWSISMHYSNYHAELALYGYDMYEMEPGRWWYPSKIPAGDWDWPIVYGPVRAIAHRYTNIVHDYPRDETITDELLHEMYIIVPYNVSYFLWIMDGTWLKDISIKYLTAIMMISGNSTDKDSPIRVNDWAYRTNVETIEESPPTFNDMETNISLAIETKDYGYWSAQYREGFGVAIFLSRDTLNLLKKPNYENSLLHIFTSGDNARRVIDYSPEDSNSTTSVIISRETQHKLYVGVWAYNGEYLAPELWYKMFIEQFYPKIYVVPSED
jgi:hypothetical protein